MNKIRVIVLAVAVAAMSAGGGSSSYSPPAPTPTPTGTGVSIPAGARTMGSAAYAPNPVTVTAGTTVTWTNNDSIAHTATSDTGGVFNSGTIAAGGKYSFTFNTRGTYPYHCTFHPGMVGWWV